MYLSFHLALCRIHQRVLFLEHGAVRLMLPLDSFLHTLICLGSESSGDVCPCYKLNVHVHSLPSTLTHTCTYTHAHPPPHTHAHTHTNTHTHTHTLPSSSQPPPQTQCISLPALQAPTRENTTSLISMWTYKTPLVSPVLLESTVGYLEIQLGSTVSKVILKEFPYGGKGDNKGVPFI